MKMGEGPRAPTASPADQAALLNEIGDAYEVARLLTELGQPASSDQVRQWKKRGVPADYRPGIARIVESLQARGNRIYLPEGFL